MDAFKKIIGKVSDFIFSHTRIVMPAVLLASVAVTIIIAVNARARAGQEEDDAKEEVDIVEDTEVVISPADQPLLLNHYPAVNQLINDYYDALTAGDSERAGMIRIDHDELGKLRIDEMVRYIDSYEDIEVYAKNGFTAGSYVAYVTYHMKLNELETPVPGMMTYYVIPDDGGRLVIVTSDFDEDVLEYLTILNEQDDVKELIKRVATEYNDLLASDPEVEKYLIYVWGKIKEDVGVFLAQSQTPGITADQLREDGDGGGTDGDATGDQPQIVTSLAVKATAVVNIRSSDSETADRLGRANIGEEFTVLEQKGNGWSKITYQGRDAYIKSEFLEIIGGGATAPVANPGAGTHVKVTSDSVRVRGTASTSGDVLGTASRGNRFELIEQMGNGWTKINYNGRTAYIRSDFVTVD